MSQINGTLYKREGSRFKPVGHSEDRFAQVAEQMRLPQKLLNNAFDSMNALFLTMGQILRNSDVAFRNDRRLQEMMRHDPDIMSPLQQRQLAVAELEWQVVAEDEEDPQQEEQAKLLTKLIDYNLRTKTDMFRTLEEAVFYGPSMVNIQWQRDRENRVVPVDWMPFHSDSIMYDDDGRLGMIIGPQHPKYRDSVAGEYGRVHIFTPTERMAVVNHTYMRQGPTFNRPMEARYIFSGRGLRDTLYYTWLSKQTAQKLWLIYIQRYGMGVRKGYYESGNLKARTEMEAAMKNLAEDAQVLLPRMLVNDNTVSVNDIEIVEPQNTRSSVFVEIIANYLSGLLKEQIIGQTGTSEGTSTGLGSDVATRHAETFKSIVRYDSNTLADTLTRDLIWPMHRMNFGDTPYRPRFQFVLEDVDSEEWMKGVQAFTDLGGVVPMRQVRNRLGIDEPKEGEEVLEKSVDPMAGLGGPAAFSKRVERFSKALR